jgi:hypothetical protein
MGEVFPCVLSYCLEHEVEVELTCPAVDGLAFALDRFRADEERFGVGLTAVLTTAEVGTLFIGSHARMGAAHLGYANQADTEAARPRLPLSRSVAGGAAATGGNLVPPVLSRLSGDLVPVRDAALAAGAGAGVGVCGARRVAG